MKRLFVFAALAALAVARPELYKEQEDFQYSRSSSDDGTKSGFYGAQRGNMGGNYERAHNMDGLAQNQMSGLVRQVEGELGDGAQTRTGSVYSAANSRGTYGSGHYDLSNLAGRNFQESSSSQSSSSRHSASAHNSAYSTIHSQNAHGGARYGGYQREHDAQAQTDDLQSLDNTHTSNQYDYGRQASHSSGHHSSSGFQEHSEYDRSNSNSQAGYGSNIHTRLISATPVRIVITPGGRVAIPVAAQTYGTTHGSSVYDQNSLNSEAESLSGNNQGSVSMPESKHYESSYSYRKKWEKHDTIPVTIPLATTETTIPNKNSELYEDNEGRSASNQYARGVDSQNAQSSSAYGRYNAVKSSSSQSRYNSNINAQQSGDSSNSNAGAYTQTGYNAHHHGASADSLNSYNAGSRYHGTSGASNLNAQTAYAAGSHSDLNSQVEDLTKPKSYQSSYSYHKSWERQGDPYVIKPASSGYYDGQTSQRLSQAHGTYTSGSHYGQALEDSDCDEYGHRRVARSYNTGTEDMAQQSVNSYDDQESGQQVQTTWQNLEDLGQRSQSNFDQANVGQESVNKWDNLQDLNQYRQSNYDQQNVGQQSENKWDNLQDFGQQSQNSYDQQSAGQQSENNWDNLQNFGQQSQNSYDQQSVGQQSENKWDNLQDFGQQSQGNFDQQNVGQESQNQWEKLEDLGQQSAKDWGQSSDLVHQSENHNTWDKLEDIAQQRPTSYDNIENLEQQNQNFRDKHTQDFATQIAYNSQQEQQIEANKPKQPHRIESPWDKFDFVNSNTRVTTEQNKLTTDKTGSNDFYWHQIANNEGIDQQKNNFDQHSDVHDSNYDIKHWEQVSDNSKRTDVDVVFDNDNNKHYSYSNGFANPSIYNHPIPEYHNTYQSGAEELDYGINHWNSHSSNSYSSVNWQQHESNGESDSHKNNFQTVFHDSPLLGFWGKIEHLEKETLSNTQHSKREETLQRETNFAATNLNETKVLPALEYPSLHPQKYKDLITTKPELPAVTTATHKMPVTSTVSPKDLATEKSEVPERPEDIGRGDIGPQDFGSSTEIDDKDFKNHGSVVQQSINHASTLSDREQQLHTNKTLISNTSTTTNKIETYRFENQQNHNRHDIDKTSILTHNKQNSSEYQMKNFEQNVNVSQQIFDLHKPISQAHDKIEQQNVKLEQQNVNNFEQQNLNIFEQQSLNNFEQHNVNNFEQQNLNNFEQQNLNNFKQQYVNNFEQQNLNNFEQQYVNNFEQQNVNNFEQQNPSNLEQQNLSNFEQQNLNNFEQQNRNNFEQQNVNSFEQQNVNNFEQQNENIFEKNTFQEEQQSEDLNQQNSNNFDQQNVQDVAQQNINGMHWDKFEQGLEHLTRDKSKYQNEKSEQQNHGQIIQDQLQKELEEEESLEKLKQSNQNVQDLGQANILQQTIHPQKSNLQQQTTPEIIEEPVIKKVYNNTESKSPNDSETDRIESPVETVSEKPGFWKSVGSKFSTAKNKVVSWFRSN